MRRLLLLAVSILLLAACSGQATDNVALYRLDTGDVIRVSVWGQDDLLTQVMVGPDGRVALPLLGEVLVRGITLSELRDLLTSNLAQFIRNPDVTVALVTPRQISVKVFGQVNRPGAFSVNPEASIAELIAMAGGPAKRAALEKVQLLKGGDPAKVELVPQGKDDKFGLGPASRGPQLADGDVVYVPETKNMDWQFIFAVLGGLLTLKQLVS